MTVQNKTVVIAGFTGSMGQQAFRLVQQHPALTLVGGYAPHATPNSNEAFVTTNQIKNLPKADIWIDFTTPSAVFENLQYAIENDYHPVVGTTGLSDQQVQELQKKAAAKQLGGIIAPNFGLSAVLLMKFAQEAAKYFPDAEVIEMHHQGKKDAPSGTAIATAKMISASRQTAPTAIQEDEVVAGVRGGQVDGVPIHSVRLPGYVAHEQVLFGGLGEALTIRQDSFDRQSFMSGVKVACEKVVDLDSLVVGLENILD